jgi:hypothetical protein
MNAFPFHPGKIFVFGSNLAGIHGAGAAKEALERYGAKWGVGAGRQGNSYASPTKDFQLKTLPLEIIRSHVQIFLSYAKHNPNEQFFVTAIGTGLAGYSHAQIAPMFRHAPENCELPPEWKELLR